MKKFRDYVIYRDSMDHSQGINMPSTDDKGENPEVNSLLYKAMKLMISKDSRAVLSFLDSHGDDEIKYIVDKIRQKKLNTEPGLGHLHGDDLERIKAPEADRAGSPEDDSADGGGGY